MGIFIRNISDHYCCSSINLNFLQINKKVFRFLGAYCSSISYRSWAFHHIIIIFFRNHLHHNRHVWINGVNFIDIWLSIDSWSISSGDRIWAVLSVFCNNSHARVHNIIYNLILFFILWFISFLAGRWIVFMFAIIMILIF